MDSEGGFVDRRWNIGTDVMMVNVGWSPWQLVCDFYDSR